MISGLPLGVQLFGEQPCSRMLAEGCVERAKIFHSPHLQKDISQPDEDRLII